MSKLAGPQFLAQATDPLMIEVVVVEPIDLTPRATSPVIILNDRMLVDTWVFPDDNSRLIAFLTDREMIKPRNTVVVAWVGNEEETRSRDPLVFTADDVE